MLFNQRTARYFLAIVQAKNISRAAESLSISQPSLSRFLSQLELEVGETFFERRRGKMVMTPAGEIYLRYVHSAMRLNSNMRQQIEKLHHPEEDLF